MVVTLDLATACCGLLNAWYFAQRVAEGTRSRRIAASALALVSWAAASEAAFSQALFWSARGASWAPELSTGGWGLARLPLFLATALVSALVVRRLVA